MYSEQEIGPLESIWRLFVSFLLIFGAIGGLFFIFGTANVWAAVGGGLLSVGCLLGLISRWKNELAALDVLFGHQAKTAGMGFAYWIKRRLDRLNTYLVRTASAVIVAAGVAVLWKPVFWAIIQILRSAVPDISTVVISLLEGLSNPAFGVLVGVFAGYGYFKSRRPGSHLKLG